jgi:hypothetical protein
MHTCDWENGCPACGDIWSEQTAEIDRLKKVMQAASAELRHAYRTAHYWNSPNIKGPAEIDRGLVERAIEMLERGVL